MKITVENITEMFEGTKELLVAGLITAITGVLILTRVSGYAVVKAPLMFALLFLITVLPGFISMLFSPMTKVTAKIFDIKNSIAMCRIFSAIYFALYWFVTLLIVNIIVSSLIQMGNGDGGMKACFAIGCFVVAVVQTKRFYGLLIK